VKKFWDVTANATWLRIRKGGIGRQFFSNAADYSEKGVETSEPAIDVWEKENEIVVEGEIPGAVRGDFTLTLDRGMLIIEGYKREPHYSSCKKFFRMERQFGYFRRVIDLPASVQSTHIDASLKDGLLVVRIPKVGERRKGAVSIPVSE